MVRVNLIKGYEISPAVPEEKIADKGVEDKPSDQAIIEHLCERNLFAKKAMAQGLSTLGFSDPAIERILHFTIKSDDASSHLGVFVESHEQTNSIREGGLHGE